MADFGDFAEMTDTGAASSGMVDAPAQAGMAEFGDFAEMTDTGAASPGMVDAPGVPVECFDADFN